MYCAWSENETRQCTVHGPRMRLGSVLWSENETRQCTVRGQRMRLVSGHPWPSCFAHANGPMQQANHDLLYLCNIDLK